MGSTSIATMGKTDRIAELMTARAQTATPGQWLASVQGLRGDAGASIATVVRGVERAIAGGAPIEARRGNEGGYFRSVDPPGPLADSAHGGDEVALAHARRARAELDELIATLERRLAA